MRSTPIPLVLLSFPHNRSLSFYSPLLNWSILHLNQDISTTGKERGKNEYKRASCVDRDTDASPFSSFAQNKWGEKKQKVEIFASAGRLWCSSGVSQRASAWSIHISIQSEERYHNKSSHQKQGKHANPVTIYSDNCWGGGSWVADRDIIHIYSAEILH